MRDPKNVNPYALGDVARADRELKAHLPSYQPTTKTLQAALARVEAAEKQLAEAQQQIERLEALVPDARLMDRLIKHYHPLDLEYPSLGIDAGGTHRFYLRRATNLATAIRKHREAQ